MCDTLLEGINSDSENSKNICSTGIHVTVHGAYMLLALTPGWCLRIHLRQQKFFYHQGIWWWVCWLMELQKQNDAWKKFEYNSLRCQEKAVSWCGNNWWDLIHHKAFWQLNHYSCAQNSKLKFLTTQGLEPLPCRIWTFSEFRIECIEVIELPPSLWQGFELGFAPSPIS